MFPNTRVYRFRLYATPCYTNYCRKRAFSEYKQFSLHVPARMFEWTTVSASVTLSVWPESQQQSSSNDRPVLRRTALAVGHGHVNKILFPFFFFYRRNLFNGEN